MVLEEAIGSLKTLEQQVIRLFFFEDMNQSETARKLGISVNYSSYLLRRSIMKIRAIMESQHAEEAGKLTDSEQAVPAADKNDIPTFDRFTGLYTEAYLRSRIAEEIARGRRYPTNFTLLLTEVSGLDTETEAVLPAITAIGHLFRHSTRIIDMTAYLGNARFALLLPHTGREARVLAQRLQSKVPALFSEPGLERPAVMLHIGFAVYPMDGTTVNSLFTRSTTTLDNAIASAAPAN
jgi:RNA polymerase sigma-B factor